MNDAPRLTLYFPTTRRAWIEAPAVSGWMTVDDVYEQAFAWFDLARELRGRDLAVEAVNQGPPPKVVFDPQWMP